MRTKTLLIGGIGIVIGVLLSTAVVFAGNLNPGVGPGDPGSQMYTLQQIYDRLVSGAAGTKMTAFTEPAAGPTAGTMRTLDEIMAAAPALDATNGATVTQVLAGRTFWGLTASQWATRTGTMANNGAVTIVPTTTVQSIAAGYHNGSGTVAGDSDLAAGNIKSGVELFGVAGTLSAGGGTYNAGIPKTGQTASSAAGDDGALQKGVAWPNPRFITGTTGVVTDTLTGLMWMTNADAGNDCAGADTGTETWANALASAATCNGGAGYAGYTDWRLPNVRELQSLIDYGRFSPALPNGHPFTGVQSVNYWTSTTHAVLTSDAWGVDLSSGSMFYGNKTNTFYVWPVRGGQ